MSDYYAPPGHEATPKTLALFREDAKRNRYGAEITALRELCVRHDYEAVKRHLPRIRRILERHAGGSDEQQRAA